MRPPYWLDCGYGDVARAVLEPPNEQGQKGQKPRCTVMYPEGRRGRTEEGVEQSDFCNLARHVRVAALMCREGVEGITWRAAPRATVMESFPVSVGSASRSGRDLICGSMATGQPTGQLPGSRTDPSVGSPLSTSGSTKFLTVLWKPVDVATPRKPMSDTVREPEGCRSTSKERRWTQRRGLGLLIPDAGRQDC